MTRHSSISLADSQPIPARSKHGNQSHKKKVETWWSAFCHEHNGQMANWPNNTFTTLHHVSHMRLIRQKTTQSDHRSLLLRRCQYGMTCLFSSHHKTVWWETKRYIDQYPNACLTCQYTTANQQSAFSPNLFTTLDKRLCSNTLLVPSFFPFCHSWVSSSNIHKRKKQSLWSTIL